MIRNSLKTRFIATASLATAAFALAVPMLANPSTTADATVENSSIEVLEHHDGAREVTTFSGGGAPKDDVWDIQG